MPDVGEMLKSMSSMPSGALVALVILCAFGLSAYAISAVVSVAKTRRRR